MNSAAKEASVLFEPPLQVLRRAYVEDPPARPGQAIDDVLHWVIMPGNSAVGQREVPDIAALRQRVLAEAETWLRTPYHHLGRIKGAGCDCLTFLAETYTAAGVFEHVDTGGLWRPDFMQHSSEETYIAGLARYGREIAGPPDPADVAIWKIGRVYSHAAIVVAWPKIIHAEASHGVIEGSGTQGALANRPVRFFSPF